MTRTSPITNGSRTMSEYSRCFSLRPHLQLWIVVRPLSAELSREALLALRPATKWLISVVDWLSCYFFCAFQ